MAHYDLLIRNGIVIDGTGAPRRRADVGVRGARIVAIGDLSADTAATDIDAQGHIVAPGFIDAHAHDDRYLTLQPEMTAKLSQGVTTVVIGNCGISMAPWRAEPDDTVPPPINLLGTDPALFRFERYADYLADLETHPAAINAACLVGHTTLRTAVLDRLDRVATPPEIEVMQGLLRESLASGAIGLSTGAAYPSAMSATTDEMARVAEVLREFGGVYASHIRDEADRVVEAIDEAVVIGAAGEAHVILSHHKLIGPRNHGRSVETLAHIRQIMQTQPVGLDCYPYAASSTILRKDRLAVSSRVIVTSSEPHPEFAGQDLDAIAAQLGLSIDDAVDVLQPAAAIYFLMDEQDVQRILAFAPTMIGSDGLPHDTLPHPRLWGTFARVLGHYCRDVGLFTLEEAVHKMTGLTATHFKLPARGVLAPGYFADVAIFDADAVLDTSTWVAPTQRAAGIHTVVVNGVPAWREGGGTGARSGGVIRLTDRVEAPEAS